MFHLFAQKNNLLNCKISYAYLLQGLLPEDLDRYLSGILKNRGAGEEEPPAEVPPDRRTNLVPSSPPAVRTDLQGYDRTDRNDMRQLIDGRKGQRRAVLETDWGSRWVALTI